MKEETSVNHELILSKAMLTLIEKTKEIMFIKDNNFRYVALSQGFADMSGVEDPKTLLGKNDFDVYEDFELAQRYRKDDEELLIGKKDLIDYLEPLREEEGKARYGSTSKLVIKDDEGNAIGIFGMIKDVTKDFMIRQHYQQELKFLFNLPEEAYASVFIDIDSWRIVEQRRQVVDKSMMHEVHTIKDLTKIALLSIVDSECPAAEFYRNFSKEYLEEIYVKGQSSLSFEYQRKMTDESIHWVRNDIHFLVDTESGHRCIMLSAFDIDEKKKEESKLIESATLDKMTKVLNRETTMKKIRKVLINEPEEIHALFMLDVDNFKMLNDTKGHQAGDEFLIELGQILKTCFRDSDIVGRIGGDEFFILMKSLPDVSIAEIKAQSVLDSVKELTASYDSIPLSVSIGVSLYPYSGNNINDLYLSADTALYQAKNAGKNQYLFDKYDES